MKRIKIILLIFFTALMHSSLVSATPPDGYSFTSYTEGLKKAKQNGKPLFIYIGRYGCGFCDLTNKESFSNPEVKKKFEATFNLVYLDTEGGRRLHLPTGETMTELEFTESMNLRGTPVFIKADVKKRPDSNNTFGKKYYGYKTDKELLMMID